VTCTRCQRLRTHGEMPCTHCQRLCTRCQMPWISGQTPLNQRHTRTASGLPPLSAPPRFPQTPNHEVWKPASTGEWGPKNRAILLSPFFCRLDRARSLNMETPKAFPWMADSVERQKEPPREFPRQKRESVLTCSRADSSRKISETPKFHGFMLVATTPTF
jgi:hypothetical protein